MKRILAIFLSFYLFLGSLIPGNSFFELSSLSPLIKHFQYHRSTGVPGISFITFLKLHYTDAKHQKSDPKNHCNLPLQHQGNSVPMDEIVNFLSTNSSTVFFSKPGNIFFPLVLVQPDDQFSSGIFHPPLVLS